MDKEQSGALLAQLLLGVAPRAVAGCRGLSRPGGKTRRVPRGPVGGPGPCGPASMAR